MGLHQATTIAIPQPEHGVFVEEDEDEDDFSDEDNGECPECGSYSYTVRQYGRYSQTAYYTFGQSRYMDYDGIETNTVDDDDGWECAAGHRATDLISEMLRDL